MVSLSDFVKCEFVRESLKKNGVLIKDVSDVKAYV